MASFSIGKLFTKHYAMERFCVMTVLLSIAVVGVVIWIAVGMQKAAAIDFANTVMFETEATGTQSGAKAVLNGVGTNKDRTRAVMHLTFDDLGAVPSDVESYDVHITGISKGRNAQRNYNRGIGGSLYLYGTTGDALIYMTCPSGFDDGVYRVSLEAKELVKASDNATVSDVFEFDIRPGGEATPNLESLEGDKFDVAMFYGDTMLASEENAAKEQLNNSISLMSEYLNAVKEYGERLVSAGIVVDGMLPKYIDGDVIGNDSNGDLFLTSKNDFPGALHLDWRHSSVLNGGYSKDVDLNGKSLSEYLGTEDIKVSKDWKFADGRVFKDVLKSNASSRYDSINADIGRFEAAVSSYCALKQLYQTSYQRVLLGIEEKALTMADTVKVKVDCVEAY